MSKKHYFNHKTSTRGENRELYYTKHEDIRKIIQYLVEKIPALLDYEWVDPCAGDGRWEEVAKDFGIKIHSYDIEPQADFVEKRDFLQTCWDDLERDLDKPIFFIGNPPFSKLKEFVEYAIKYVDFCYFLGGPQIITGSLGPKVLVLHRFEGYEGNQKDKRTKLVFTDSNGNDVKIWTVGALFGRHKIKEFDVVEKSIPPITFKIYPGKYVVEDFRVRKIKKDETK